MNSIHEPAMPMATSPLTSPRPGRSRTQSISSDRPSVAAHSLMSPPLSVSPEPGFIAASAASQIVTNDHDTHAALWYDQHGLEPSDETAIVSPPALQLVNNFLDQLLFNILAKSRSTALSALRPAVTEVLKPKLAKDALNQADEELHEYLGGGDEDDLLQQGPASPQDWDIELVWKRTRLRCMVYSSLGDMEEEDEDYHMEQEGLELDDGDDDVISPAVAIFLTSILEYMGEQALVVSGQGAYHRLQSRLEKEVKSGNRDPGEVAERVVVDELDMDRVALDRTLGRLWRAWKKRIRSPTFDSRPYSRNSGRGSHFRQNSAIALDYTLPETPTVDEVAPGVEAQAAEPVPDELAMASAIPLPMGERDVDEIEVPGLTAYSDDEDDEEEDEQFVSKRPNSMLPTLPSAVLSSPASSTLLRKRSNSVPSLSITTFVLRESVSGPEEDENAVDAAEPMDPVASPGIGDSETEEFEPAPEIDVVSPESTQTDADDAVAEDSASRNKPAEVEEDEVEHFEILTTARVSISGGNSPVISDSDMSRSSSRQAKRPASISSPRLIEVAGPKSPVARSSSMREARDLAPVPQAADESRHKPQAVETIFRSPISSPVSRSPSARHQQPVKGLVTGAISEDEVPHAFSTQGKPTTSAPIHTSTPANISPKDRVHALPMKQSHAATSYPSRHHGPPSPIQEHAYSGTKVTIVRNSDSRGHVQAPPDPPRKQSVPNRSYPPHAQDRAARQPSIGASSIGTGGKQDASDSYPNALASAAPRQIHTSGSSVSSGTSRLKPVRTSEESSSTKPEDVARNFEELIQSDQTIQYTLTPESMRDFDASSVKTSGVQTKSRKSDDVKRINTNRSRSSSNGASSARVGGSSIDVKRSPSTTRQNGSSIHSQSPKKSTLSGPVPRAPKNGASQGPQPARSQIQARDPRMARDSMGDFADFIRATGPAGGNNGPSPLRNAAPASISSAKNSVDTRRVSTTSSRARLQARDPTVDGREDHSDLIDFIRRGPSDGPGTHRIPRAVAPFRTTMDSDQLSAVVGGRAVDAMIPEYRDSRASASATDKSPSMPSSINSNTALLKKKPSHQMMGGALDEEPHMPKRKTRRVKDPYAIDFSDEEEDDYVQPVKPPAKKEESLAEFLMNYEPPPENPPATPVQQAPQIKKKKSSASNLFGRFRSGTASSSRSEAPSVAPTANPMPRTSTLPRTNTSGSGKGYIPIQVNMPPGYDRYGPVDRPAPPKAAPSAGGIPRKKFEPRDAMTASSRTGTSDLAAFLRSSEPPHSGPVRPAYPPIEEEGGSVSRMLGRRKKAAV